MVKYLISHSNKWPSLSVEKKQKKNGGLFADDIFKRNVYERKPFWLESRWSLFLEFNWQSMRTVSVWYQAITWTSHDLIVWYIYASPSLDVSNPFSWDELSHDNVIK